MAFNVIVKRAVSAAKALPDAPMAASGIVQASGAGAVLHLDARVGVTSDINGRVSSWADQSPTGNNFGQVVSANQPILMTDIYGNKGIKFDPSVRSDHLIGAVSDHRDKTIVLVVKEQLHTLNPSKHRYLMFMASSVRGIYLYDMVYGSNGVRPYFALSDRAQNAIKTLYNSDNVSNHVFYTRYTATLTSANNALRLTRQSRGITYSAAGWDNAGIPPIGVDILGFDSVPSAYYSTFIVYEVAVFDKLLTNQESISIDSYIATTYGAL